MCDNTVLIVVPFGLEELPCGSWHRGEKILCDECLAKQEGEPRKKTLIKSEDEDSQD